MNWRHLPRCPCLSSALCLDGCSWSQALGVAARTRCPSGWLQRWQGGARIEAGSVQHGENGDEVTGVGTMLPRNTCGHTQELWGLEGVAGLL